MRQKKMLCLAISFLSIGLSGNLFAYKLSPRGTATEVWVAQKNNSWWQRVVTALTGKGLPHFSEAVHEEVSHRMFGCKLEGTGCANLDELYASPYVLAGVRWNDDPPFLLSAGQGRGTSCNVTEPIRFTTQPGCWYELFKDAEKKAAAGKVIDAKSGMSLLARSHFGDLQFLHAMASRDGEEAFETKKRIMMWSELTWRVAMGEYGLATKVKDIKVEGIGEFFGLTDWTLQDLFTLGNPGLRRNLKEIALGSLLHMVQDSFAKGHTDRAEPVNGKMCEQINGKLAPGSIKEFHSYGNQNGEQHAHYDSRDAFAAHSGITSPDVVEVGRTLISFYESVSPWEQVKPYMDCIFALQNPNTPSSAGHGFSK